MIYEKSRTDLTQIKPFGGLSSRHLTVTPFPQERADVPHICGVILAENMYCIRKEMVETKRLIKQSISMIVAMEIPVTALIDLL